MNDEFPVLYELLKNEKEITQANIKSFREYIPYFEKLTIFIRIAVDRIGSIRHTDRWGHILFDFLRRIEESAVTSFSMFLKGYPNQGLLCLRPALEATGYAWYIHQDPQANINLWIEYDIKKIKGEKIGRDLERRHRQTFLDPRFPQEIYPLQALKPPYDRCSELSAHIGIPGSLMYYAFDTGRGYHYLITIAGIIIETLRNVAAAVGEICTKSFPTLPWQDLNRDILIETPHFLIRKRLGKTVEDIKQIIQTKQKIFIQSKRSKAKIKLAIAGLREGPLAKKLIERLENEELETHTERGRAEKVLLIIKQIINEQPPEEEKKFEGTESEFLKPIDEFLRIEEL
jgi:hypothetical protein